MLARDNPRALPQPLRAENFPANWPNELFSHSFLGAAEETSQNFRGRLGWDYSRHEPFITPKVCPGSRIMC